MESVILESPATEDLGAYKYGWSDLDTAGKDARRGLSEEVVRNISLLKNEPQWMLDLRLKGLRLFGKKPMPRWGADLSGIDFQNIKYFVRSTEKQAKSWEDLPEEIKNTYDRLGIPEAEKQRLVSGVAAQYECLSADTRVLTSSGYKKIKDIAEKDHVFSYDEELEVFVLAPVKAVRETGFEKTFMVSFAAVKSDKASSRMPGDTVLSDKASSKETIGTSGAAEGDFSYTGRLYADKSYADKSYAGKLSPTDQLQAVGFETGDLRADDFRTDDFKTGNFEANEPESLFQGKDSFLPDAFTEADNFQALSFLKATARHPFLVWDEKLLWKELKDLKPGDLVASPKKLPDFEESSPFKDHGSLGGELYQNQSGAFGDAAFGNAAFSDVLHLKESLSFKKVLEIKDHIEEPVWDIEVDGPHNFVAEGIVVHNSEVVYHQIREDLEEKGVIFLDTDSGLKEHPELFREYFGSVIPVGDNKFAALNTAVWSGGSFIYVPKGVKVDIPLQAYFRINTENMGQFERTLIIADEGSSIHYVEGCLPSGSPVKMEDGSLKAIEDIEVGDFVISDDGEAHRVKATQVRDLNGNLHTLFPFSTANAFSLTDEHPVYVVKKEKSHLRPSKEDLVILSPEKLSVAQPEYVPAREVREGDFLVFPKASFKKADAVSADFMRFLGYYLAVGEVGVNADFMKSFTKSDKRSQTASASSQGMAGEQPNAFTKSLFYNLSAYGLQEKSFPPYGQQNDQKAQASALDLQEPLDPQEQSYLRAPLSLSFDLFGESAKEVKMLLEKLYPGSFALREDQKSKTSTFFLYGEEVYRDLVFHGGKMDQKLSGNIMGQEEGLLDALLVSYLKGKKALVKNASKKSYKLEVSSKIFALQLQSLLARKGFFVKIEKTDPKSFSWQLSWSEKSFQVKDMGEYFLVPIVKKTSQRVSQLVYNLDVEMPDSFLVNGFAVHNCTAPIYSSDSLHSAVVEIVVKKDAHVRYTTIQNWSNNVYNLVTKRTSVAAGGRMEWIDGNIGCLAQGSLITTKNGMKGIESVFPGEEVLAYDEKEGLVFRKVLGKRFAGVAPVREVRAGERALRVTDNHPFYSLQKKKSVSFPSLFTYTRADQLEEAVVPTKSIEYGSAQKIEVVEKEEVFFKETTPFIMENLGRDLKNLFVGHLRYEASTFSKNSEYKDAESHNDECRSTGFKVPNPSLYLNSLVASPDFEVFGFDKLKTLSQNGFIKDFEDFDKESAFEQSAKSESDPAFPVSSPAFTMPIQFLLPTWILSLPKDQRIAFLKGFLKKDSFPLIISPSEGFSVMLGKVFTSLGVLVSFVNERNFPDGYVAFSKGKVCALKVENFKDVKSFFESLQEITALEKITAFEETNDYVSGLEDPASFKAKNLKVVRVKVSKPLEEVPTWDIEVEGTGNFLSEGFIVHNSKVTMKYPACYLLGERASGEVLSLAFAGENQHQDTGAKMVHAAPKTTSNIVSKSVSNKGGRTSYRGLVQVQEGATGSKSSVVCDALLVDSISRSDTYPYVDIREDDVSMGHEATVSKVGDDQLFYLMSRGLTEEEAMAMVVRGFVEPVVRQLPMEYALELNRLIEIDMSDSVG